MLVCVIYFSTASLIFDLTCIDLINNYGSENIKWKDEMNMFHIALFLSLSKDEEAY